MEFGIFNSLYTPHQVYEDEADQWAVEAQRLRNEVAWTKAADRAGFKYSWATEHHFLTEYSHLSSNEAFLGYMAGVTERIHLGSGIFNVTPPVAHPARVAALDPHSFRRDFDGVTFRDVSHATARFDEFNPF